MPARRLSMRKVQEGLRLLLVCGLSQRQGSRARGVGRGGGEGLESLLYPPARRPPAEAERPEADWAAVHEELKRRDMTLSLVWQESREQHPGGYQYSRFGDLYRAWRGELD